ncbi:hypothetical protein P4631_09235 [Halalkalibacterium halodurans]|uniref:hypothetical protein n=1 Tax=Halalkalibacterium halodurans TaxID=86665 RepID=UPI002E1ABCDB|nr:hypothetical protein [Halalkalibacterium halodurans]
MTNLTQQATELIEEIRRQAYAEGFEVGRNYTSADVMDEMAEGQRKRNAQAERDVIVQKARSYLWKLMNDDGYYEVDNYLPFSLLHCNAEYIVNKEKRTVAVLLRGKVSGRIYARGKAKCAPGDCFNVYIGKAIALHRALGLPVPDELLNAPQPTEVRVGDRIRVYYSDKRKGYFEDEVLEIYSPTAFRVSTENFTRYSTSDGDRIIDDSRDE